MAREVHKFAVTVPAGTPIATPQLSPLTMPARAVEIIEVVVPPGPRGTVGFALAAAGVQIIPYAPEAFFVADGEKLSYELTDQITSGAWQLLAYNTGRFNHTLEIRFIVALNVAPDSGPALLPAASLSSDGTTAATATAAPASPAPGDGTLTAPTLAQLGFTGG